MQSTECQPQSVPSSPYISLNSVRSADVVVPIVLEYIRARSVVDFGCSPAAVLASPLLDRESIGAEANDLDLIHVDILNRSRFGAATSVVRGIVAPFLKRRRASSIS